MAFLPKDKWSLYRLRKIHETSTIENKIAIKKTTP